MKIKDFDFYKDLIRRQSGLYISTDKAYLLSSRLTPIASEWGFKDFDDMTMALRGFPEDKLVSAVIDAMTENETSFFADHSLFQSIAREIIPFLIKEKKYTHINIWSAGCATGQEAYSLALLLEEDYLKRMIAQTKIHIHASDISYKSLDKAIKGIYSQIDIQNGLPVETLTNYFDQDGKNWVIKEDLSEKIHFFYFNLIDSMESLPKYDIIICHDVLDNFDYERKAIVLDNFASKLTEDGFLITSKNEEVLKFTDQYSPSEHHESIYTLKKST